jgi:antirestriction protein ArdC
MNTQKIYDKITNTIIEMLEHHKENNFSESWISLSNGSPYAKNAVSNHVYSGINQLLLSIYCQKYKYSFNSWMTFKQLSKLNGKIRKGSKAAFVVFKSVMYFDTKTNKNITKLVEHLIKIGQSLENLDFKKVGYMKGYNVFNISQIENLPAEYYKHIELEKLTDIEQNENAETLISNTGANIIYLPQNRAFYNHLEDKVYLPLRKQFVDSESFYNVIFHEISHWTSNSNRLDRPKAGAFGDIFYAFEELIAEISAAFVCAHLGFNSKISENVDYINSWLQVMKNDKQFVVQAASQAQKACNYILAFSEVDEKVVA